MPERKILLLIVLGIILAAYFLEPLFNDTFLRPLNEAEAKLSQLRKDVSVREESDLKLMRDSAQFKQWKSVSLPPDPLIAQRVYQEWLTELTQLAGWTDLKVTLDRCVPNGKAYTTIPVTLIARATRGQLGTFIRHFEEVDLIQRIARLDLESLGSSGDPKLNITLTAEGLALQDAPTRQVLFPRANLVSEIAANDTQIQIVEEDSFSATVPFRLRIGTEFVTVTQQDGDRWSIERGTAQSNATGHEEGATAEFVPLKVAEKIRTNPQVVWMSQRPFVKPAPPVNYRPKLVAGKPAPVVVGEKWSLKLNAESWNPADGKPTYLLIEPLPERLESLQIDAKANELRWTPAKGTEPGEYKIQIALLTSETQEPRDTLTVPLVVRLPNLPPRIRKLGGPVIAYLGREMKLELSADDPDAATEKFTFAFEGDVPEGMKISEKTGVMTWTPPADLELGDKAVRVTVKDSGTPPQSDSVTITIKLNDDSAALTFLIACIRKGPTFEAWFNDRTTGKTRICKAGDPFAVADLKLSLVDITSQEAILESADSRFRLSLGNHLRQMTAIPKPAPPVESVAKTEAVEIEVEPAVSAAAPANR